MAWIFLTIAVLSNITSNVMFKLAMAAFPQERTFETLLRFAFNPYLWAGGLACVLLLGCYLLALRDLSLMMSYVFVISLSMVGITVASVVFFGDALSLKASVGAALVIAGVSLIASANHAPEVDTADTANPVGMAAR